MERKDLIIKEGTAAAFLSKALEQLGDAATYAGTASGLVAAQRLTDEKLDAAKISAQWRNSALRNIKQARESLDIAEKALEQGSLDLTKTRLEKLSAQFESAEDIVK